MKKKPKFAIGTLVLRWDTKMAGVVEDINDNIGMHHTSLSYLVRWANDSRESCLDHYIGVLHRDYLLWTRDAT